MSEETIHETEETKSRKGFASYFRRLANKFGGEKPVPVDEEETVTVDPPEESDFEVEVERDGDEISLEIEVEWEGDEDDVDTDAGGSDATFELYQDNADEWRWRLRHDNGNIIADGGEGYTKKANAENGIESVRENAPGADIEEQ